MATKNRTQDTAPSPASPTMVNPGERAVLLSYHEYHIARSLGNGLESYDLLMRAPDDEEPSRDGSTDGPRWSTVRADKYLKHRANGWCEAESMDELPTTWRDKAQGRQVFPATSNTPTVAESEGGK